MELDTALDSMKETYGEQTGHLDYPAKEATLLKATQELIRIGYTEIHALEK